MDIKKNLKLVLLLISFSIHVGCSRNSEEKTKNSLQKGPTTLDELVWKFKTAGEVVSSPAVSADLVFVGSEDGNLYAVDIQSGLEQWKVETQQGSFPEQLSSGQGAFSPLLSDGKILFGACDGYLRAVDAKTGKEKWRFKTGGFIKSSPNVLDSIAYIGSEDGFFYAINIKTGQEVWKFETEGRPKKAAIWDGKAYFKSNEEVYSVNLITGKEVWKISTKDNSRTSDPIVSNGIVYFGCYDENGISLNGVDAKSGEKKWRIKPEFFVTNSVCVEDGIIYFSTADRMYAVDIESKREKWSFAAGSINSPPVISGRILYFGCMDKRIYAIDIKTGQEMWKFQSEDRVLSSPVISNGAVFFGSCDKHLYMLR